MQSIRPATKEDAGRIAEMLVFNNRLSFFPIFQDEGYSFGKMQVLTVARQFQEDARRLADTLVYDDGIVRGMVTVHGDEVRQLYVEPCLQGHGVGTALLRYAVEERHATHLWALEKNGKALRFYQRHGFLPTGEKELEPDTEEYLLHLRLACDCNNGPTVL